jgi:hypothetical protein
MIPSRPTLTGRLETILNVVRRNDKQDACNGARPRMQNGQHRIGCQEKSIARG